MTDENVNYREHIDPEYRRWGRKYPRFPGVSECVRLLQVGKAKGAWIDIISFELQRHARESLLELIDAFKRDSTDHVRVLILIALENARLSESVPFLIDVLREGNPTLAPIAERALREIDTRESRSALWAMPNSRPGS